MAHSAVFIALFVLLGLAQSLPTGGRTRSRKDIELMLDDIRFPADHSTKAGIVGDRYRWPNRELIYEIDPAFSASERSVIDEAFYEISSRTCVRFVQRQGQGDFVFIGRGDRNTGCNSYVGKIGGSQRLNLQAPYANEGHCIWVGTIAHELIHAIGYYHEQSRTDRDDFVYMNWDNIPQEYHFAFDKYDQSYVDPFGVPYDYASIMHYDAYAFAIDRNVPTIYPKQSGVTLGNTQLTQLDIQKINNMYKC